MSCLDSIYPPDCLHSDIDDDVCQDCGKIFEDTIMEMENIFPDGDNDVIDISKKKEKFCYLTELSRLEDIHDDVKSMVFEKVRSMEKKSHIRINTHRKNLFVFIYISYNILGKHFNPSKIGKDIGLDAKQIRLAIKSASDGIDGMKNPICMLPPCFYFKELAVKFKHLHEFTEKQLEKLTNLSERLIETNPMIYNERPIGIASTIIKMFLEHNKKFNTEFYTICGMTPGYVKLIESIIISTLNNESS